MKNEFAIYLSNRKKNHTRNSLIQDWIARLLSIDAENGGIHQVWLNGLAAVEFNVVTDHVWTKENSEELAKRKQVFLDYDDFHSTLMLFHDIATVAMLNAYDVFCFNLAMESYEKGRAALEA